MNEVSLVESLTIVNKKGLHARAASLFVKQVEQFDARVSVEKDGQRVAGNSIMGLMMFWRWKLLMSIYALIKMDLLK